MKMPRVLSDYPKDHRPVLHDIDECRAIYEMAEADPDASLTDIAEAAGSTKSRAQRWLRWPERYSPFPDDVAIERAAKERPVYDHLSILEKNMFWDQWTPIIQAEYDAGNHHEGAMPVRDAMISLLGMSGISMRHLIHRTGEAIDGAGA
jgi:hypothetical protein